MGNIDFGWKIEFLFLVLGASVIPGHCGGENGLGRAPYCLQMDQTSPVTGLPTIGSDSGATELWNQNFKILLINGRGVGLASYCLQMD